MIDLKCSECGCTIPPDSTKCPNCGHQHSQGKTETSHNGNGIKVGRIGYQIVCPTHGKIQITSTVASQSVKCPFCG